ncbi:hypothetical protein [Acidovorax sp.]|uniref:hypothetical protein n=1 Tax=Acidovorax sp. TaxID=1872122 RepID=UPI0026220B48|nr:hypothetical protein [Acidovorax sp.]
MTKSHYQAVLLSSLILGFMGVAVDFAVPSQIPEGIRNAESAHFAEMSLPRLLFGVTLSLTSIALVLVATYGLYRFRHWAPRLAVLGTATSLLAGLAGGLYVQSGIAAILTFVASYAWGASVVLAYAQPYRAWFGVSNQPLQATASGGV